MLLFTLFAVIWAGGLIVSIVGAITSGRSQYRSGARPKLPWYGKLWLTVTALFILGTIAWFFIARDFAREHLEDLAASPPPNVVLRDESRELVLSDDADKRAFLPLLNSGSNVSGHHSHPVDRISVQVGSGDDQYNLGRDSSKPQEFWLESRSGLQIRQFNSPALDAWLRSHWPPRRGPAPATAPIPSE